MKFIDAIKTMGPGQLLIDPKGDPIEVINGLLCEGKYPFARIAYVDLDSWKIEDKPRPRVRFSDAMRAALDGKVIKSHLGFKYRIYDGTLIEIERCKVLKILATEFRNDWEIIEPEGDK